MLKPALPIPTFASPARKIVKTENTPPKPIFGSKTSSIAGLTSILSIQPDILVLAPDLDQAITPTLIPFATPNQITISSSPGFQSPTIKPTFLFLHLTMTARV